MKNTFTPLFYSIGNFAEETRVALEARYDINSSFHMILPYKFTERLNYKIASAALFEVASKVLNGTTTPHSVALARFLVNLRFVTERSTYLLLKRFALEIPSLSFPSLGKAKLYSTNDYTVRRRNIHEGFETGIKNHSCTTFPGNQQQWKDLVNDTFKGKSNLFTPRAPFVCLHVRESGFHNDATRRSYRNSDIATYYEAIDFLLSKGLIVVRLGDASMTKLGIARPGLVDYPFSKYKSDYNDLSLIANAKFYIGTNSGILDVAYLFRVPVLVTNMHSWIIPPHKPVDRGVLKSIRIGGTTYRGFRDWLNVDYHYANIFNILDGEACFIDNSEGELYCSVRDYFYCMSHDLKDLPDHVASQFHERLEHFNGIANESIGDLRHEFRAHDKITRLRLRYINNTHMGAFLN